MFNLIKRLHKQWKETPLIIAVDFDDTIKPFRFQSQKKCDKIIDLLKKFEKLGCTIVIFTASRKNRYNMIMDYCKDKGLNIFGININPMPELYGNDGKIFYNIFLDDRAGLEQTIRVLKILYILNYFKRKSK